MPQLRTLAKEDIPAFSDDVWNRLVQHIFATKQFSPSMLSDAPVRAAIDETCRILSQGVESCLTQDVPQELADHLLNDTFLFSGFKTYHEAREISSRLLDTVTGTFRSFEKFLDEVRSINSTYNGNYLYAEYNFAVQSTQMAVRWHDFEQDGDRYLLQYRTANDGLVRPEHQALHNTTLPIADPFWNAYTPPLGWNCRCTVVQVLRGKYPESDSQAAIRAGEAATAKPKQQIFRFNPGKTERVFPPKHPYFPKGCGDCQFRAERRLGYKPNNPMCQACTVLAACNGSKHDESAFTYRSDKEMFKIRKAQVSSELRSAGGLDLRQGNFYTQHFYMGSEDIKCVLQHAFSSEELDAAAKLYQIIPQLHDGKYLPIDTSRPNYKRKMTAFGIRHFVAYEVNIDGKNYVLKCKAIRDHNTMYEYPYSLKEK